MKEEINKIHDVLKEIYIIKLDFMKLIHKKFNKIYTKI